VTTPTRSFLPAALGFAFVAVAFSQSFWIALLCLIGAGAFHVGYGLYRGDLSLAELRERAKAARSGFSHPDPSSPGREG
jgi:hypothetical protein